MIKRLTNSKASVTVEAAIILPFLICAVLTIGFFIKIYYVHEIIHHAMTETANELSKFSYYYHVNGLHKIIESHESTENQEDIQGITEVDEIADFFLLEEKDDLLDNYIHIMIKELSKKHFITRKNISVDKRLEELNVVNGWNGLDFSLSNYLKEGQDIDLIVTYKMDLPLPIKFNKEIPIFQRITLRAWMEGSVPTDFLGNQDLDLSIFPEGLVDEIIVAGYDIWGLPVFHRGREIKSLLNRNLHEDFPIIDTIENNHIVSIRTHDTRLTSNQERNFYYSLMQDIRRLEDYEEGSHQGVTINEKDYDGKVLNIVIPYVALTEEQIKSFEDAKLQASSKNIKIKVTVVK